MRYYLSIIAIPCLIASVGANPAPESDEIREAIKNLDDPEYRVRELAAKKLASAGKRAIEPLTKAAVTGSIESSTRALKILEEFAGNGDEETLSPASDALRKLAQSKSQVRKQALEIL